MSYLMNYYFTLSRYRIVRYRTVPLPLRYYYGTVLDRFGATGATGAIGARGKTLSNRILGDFPTSGELAGLSSDYFGAETVVCDVYSANFFRRTAASDYSNPMALRTIPIDEPLRSLHA